MPTTYAIPDGRTVMAATTWTGVNTSAAITISNAVNGVSFQPDLVWGKPRSLAYSHSLSDSVRGANKRLQSQSTAAEDTNLTYGYTSSFNSDGFTTTPGATDNENWNTTGATFVAWQWKAGGTAVSNTAGSITSSVSANTTAGFSVVTYTGTGANATVGHGLGVAPSMVIIKKRSAVGAWVIGFTYSGFTWSTDYFQFDTSAKHTDGAGTVFTAAPTSTVFSLGTDAGENGSGATFVAYCFAAVAGYSAFGSYTGNGSTDGTFVYTGFRPRFVLIKITNTTSSWFLFDSSRSTYNSVLNYLLPNDSGAAGDLSQGLDFLSNGFKLRDVGNGLNGSGNTYIYAAFAENPFRNALAR